jgi:hypothetical protein
VKAAGLDALEIQFVRNVLFDRAKAEEARSAARRTMCC